MNFSGYDYEREKVLGDGEGPNGDGYREEVITEADGDGGFDEWILAQPSR
jgi:hypothetical protein